MRKLTKKIFSSLSSERKGATTAFAECPEDKEEVQSAVQTQPVDSDDDSPTTSVRKVPVISKLPPMNIQNSNSSLYPRFLPTEMPLESPLQFTKIPSFGTCIDNDDKPYTVYCIEVRSSMTMPFTWNVYRRFSQFCRLRNSLIDCEGIKVPELPPRSPEYSLEQTISRKRLLEEWLHTVIEMHLKTPGMEPIIHNEQVRRFLTEDFNIEPPSFTTRYSSPRQIPSNHSLICSPASPGGSKVLN